MNILQAIADEQLLRPFLSNGTGSLASWRVWREAVACLYGLPVKSPPLVRECTGRDPERLPPAGFDVGLFLTGRRSGKSRIAATIAAFEAAVSGRHRKLASGEQGLVPIISPTLSQSRIVRGYIREAFERSPMLSGQIVEEQRSGFTLRNGVRIETLAGDWRSVRGYSLLCVIVDEAAFLGQDDRQVRSDTELVRALMPGLATTDGKMIAISSPYGRFGWCYKTYERCFGNDDGDALAWNASSRTMNPTLPKKVVDKAMRADLASAKAEYLAEFRDDIAAFVSVATVTACVKPGRTELPPLSGIKYTAFADLSGARNDDACLAIAHREGDRVVVDCLRRWRPPYVPREAIGQMAAVIDSYKVRRCYGDNYAAEFVSRAFRDAGVRYETTNKAMSELYLDLLPLLTGEEIVLPEHSALVDQLTRLERRTRSGGRDIVDHPRGGSDDLANVVAGVANHCLTKQTISVGGF